MNKLLLSLFAGAALTAVADPWNAYWIGPDAGGSINEVSNWSYDQTSPLEADKFLHLPEGGGIGSRLFTVDSPMSILGFVFNAPEDVKTKVQLNAPLKFTQGNDMNRDVTATTNSFEVDFGTSKAVVQDVYDKKLYMPGTWTMNEGSLLELTLESAGGSLQFEVVGALRQEKSEVRWTWDCKNSWNNGTRRFVVDEGAEWTMNEAVTTFQTINPVGLTGVGGFGWLYGCENHGLLSMNASTNAFSTLQNTGTFRVGNGSYLGHTSASSILIENRDTGLFEVQGPGNIIWTTSNSSEQFARIDNEGTVRIGTDDAPADLVLHGGSVQVSNAVDGVIELAPGSSLKMEYETNQGTGHLTTQGALVQRNAEVVYDWVSPGCNTPGNLPPRGFRIGTEGSWTLADASVAFATSSVNHDVWGFADNVSKGALSILDGSRFRFPQVENSGRLTLAGGSVFGVSNYNAEHRLVNLGEVVATDGENCFGVFENRWDFESMLFFQQRKRAAGEGEDEADVPSPSLRIGTNDTDVASLLMRAGYGHAFCDLYDGTVDIGRAATLEVSSWINAYWQPKHAKVRNYGAKVRQGGTVVFRPAHSGNMDIGRDDWDNKTVGHVENGGDWLFDGGEEGAVLRLALSNVGTACGVAIPMTLHNSGRMGGSGLVRLEDEYGAKDVKPDHWNKPDIFCVTNTSTAEFHVDNGGLELRGATLWLSEGSTLAFNLGATPFEKGLSVTTVTNPNNESVTKGGKIIFPAGLKADIRASFADLKGWTGKHRIELVKAETSIEGGLAGVTVNGVEPDADGVVTVDGQVVRTALSHEGNAWYLNVAVPTSGMTVFIK